MKKIILFYIASFLASSAYAQEISGEILYKKIIHSDDLQKATTAASRNMRAVANASEGLTYVLTFNSEASTFQLQDMTGRDSERLDARANSIGGGKGLYYKKLNSEKTLHQTESLGSDFIVEIPESKYDWEITKETRRFGNYTARKAVASYISKAPMEHLEDQVVHLEAWFTNEIPLAFGPREINGLPGMVLKFSMGRITYSAFEVSINKTDQVPDLSPPTKGKLVSEEGFSQIAREMIDRLKN